MVSRLAKQAILIVEDEAIIAECLAMIVEEEDGIVVGPVCGVAQALRCVEREVVDAAILDVNLRDGEVTPLIGVLRQRGIPFIVQTGGIQPERIRNAIGDAPVFRKPTSFEGLLAALQSLIGAKERVSDGKRHRGHALVIEDDENQAAIVEAYLIRLGFGTVDRAATMSGAVAASERRRPEFMLVDVRLREGDGFAAASEIQARFGAIPALFMTAYPGLVKDREQTPFLKKPFTSLDLEAALSAPRPGI